MHVVYFNSLCCLIYKVCASFENVDMIINIRTSHVFNRGILTMLGQWNCRFCLPSTARMCLQLPQECFIILNYFHYLSLFLILRIETFKYASNHQIFDIKSRTWLMYDGSDGICSVHSEIRESDMCKFENNGVRNFQQRKAQK